MELRALKVSQMEPRLPIKSGRLGEAFEILTKVVLARPGICGWCQSLRLHEKKAPTGCARDLVRQGFIFLPVLQRSASPEMTRQQREATMWPWGMHWAADMRRLKAHKCECLPAAQRHR